MYVQVKENSFQMDIAINLDKRSNPDQTVYCFHFSLFIQSFFELRKAKWVKVTGIDKYNRAFVVWFHYILLSNMRKYDDRSMVLTLRSVIIE